MHQSGAAKLSRDCDLSASEATLTASRNAPATFEARNHGISGPLMAQKKNAGTKMPIVAVAQGGPSFRY